MAEFDYSENNYLKIISEAQQKLEQEIEQEHKMFLEEKERRIDCERKCFNAAKDLYKENMKQKEEIEKLHLQLVEAEKREAKLKERENKLVELTNELSKKSHEMRDLSNKMNKQTEALIKKENELDATKIELGKKQAEMNMKIAELGKLNTGLVKKISKEAVLKVLQNYVNRSKNKSQDKKAFLKTVVLEIVMQNNLALPEDLKATIESLDDVRSSENTPNIVVEGDYVAGNKNVGGEVKNVESGATGIIINNESVV